MTHIHKNIGRFAGIPNSVVESDAFKSLNGNSAKLLIILAYQYNSHNNGDLVITPSVIGSWLNKNTMDRAKKELYKKGFIVINAYGGLGPNWNKLPSLYAITWQPASSSNFFVIGLPSTIKQSLGETAKTLQPIDSNSSSGTSIN